MLLNGFCTRLHRRRGKEPEAPAKDDVLFIAVPTATV
jgi:hypothetical protein